MIQMRHMKHITQLALTAILQHLVRRVDSWTLVDETMMHNMEGLQKFCDNISTVLQSEEALNRMSGFEWMKSVECFGG